MVSAIFLTINWQQILGKSETIVEATINQIKNNNTGTQNEQHFYLKGSPIARVQPRTSKGITDLLSLNLILLNTNCPIKQIVNLDELTYYQVTLHRRLAKRTPKGTHTGPTVSTSDCW